MFLMYDVNCTRAYKSMAFRQQWQIGWKKTQNRFLSIVLFFIELLLINFFRLRHKIVWNCKMSEAVEKHFTLLSWRNNEYIQSEHCAHYTERKKCSNEVATSVNQFYRFSIFFLSHTIWLWKCNWNLSNFDFNGLPKFGSKYVFFFFWKMIFSIHSKFSIVFVPFWRFFFCDNN